MPIDRRRLIAGAAVAAASLRAKKMFAVGPDFGQRPSWLQTGQSVRDASPPIDLLSRTYPADVLAKTLQSAQAWHPFPRAAERGPWEAIPQDVRDGIVARADKLPPGPLPTLTASMFLNYHVNGDRYPFDSQYFERRKQLNVLVLAECVQANGRYLSRIADTLWTMCEETFWGIPAHTFRQAAGDGLSDVTEYVIDLYTAEAAMDLAWTRYLLGPGLDTISPQLNKRIVYETTRRFLEPGRTREDFWWMGLGSHAQRVNNWNPWICSNWMATVLLIEEDRTKRLAGVAKILKVADQFLNQYPADAGEEEGPGYWSRSPACYFQCVQTLASATGAGTTVLQHPFLRTMGEYIVHAHIAGKSYTDYGDAHIEANPNGALVYRYGAATGSEMMKDFGAYLANRYGIARTAATGGFNLGDTQDLGRMLADVFSVTELRGAKQADAMLRDSWYPLLGFMAAREKDGSAEGFYLAAQTSNNGRSHGHLDSGSFIVYHDGSPVFIDLGTQTYTKTTFSKDRTTLWSIQSAFHNLPTIGGVEQAQGGKYRATGLKYSMNDDATQLVCDLATAYPATAGITQWNRTMRLDRKAHEVVFEEAFALNREALVSFSMMTTRAATSKGDGVIQMRADDATSRPVTLSFDASALTFRVERIDLKDAALREAWGPVVYRILLASKTAVKNGHNTMRLRVE